MELHAIKTGILGQIVRSEGSDEILCAIWRIAFKEMMWVGLSTTWGKLGSLFWVSSYDLVDDVVARLIRYGRLGSLDDI